MNFHRFVFALSALTAIVPHAFAAAPPAAKEIVATINPKSSVHDFDFLVGEWRVRHHRLKERLAGSTEWEDFPGSCVMRKLMNGYGNVDDNVVEIPSGTYQGVGLRSFDAATKQWSIWWLDSRYPLNVDPPVRGSFVNGVGTFQGEDTFKGNPVVVRFIWSNITAKSAHWEQAFSPDGGKTWETNWTMEFERVK